ncbi:class I SAM-dependent methyltransferase [Pedobacter sp. AW31-3R]|uniref:class I SAM-dependent methyltransferase n=1 Tax=Pedobacter sp. AW31-3R TaxID=3445781 RepID=UPI003F9EDF19
MYNFHKDRFEYFQTQIKNTEKYVIPFIEESGVSIKKGTKVLEIGSAEGGVLKAFVNKGCEGTGVELDNLRVLQSNDYLKKDINAGTIVIYNKNIYDPLFKNEFAGKFNLIILKDVIEHIHEQEKLISVLHSYLTEDGYIFFGFPPWRMPFGGHQQVCKNKFLSRLPWIHLLPNFIYKNILLSFGEDPTFFMETKETRISIARFEKIVHREGFCIAAEKHFLINPIYEYKFKMRPREQFKMIKSIPHLRDFLTTCVYYLIKNKN